MSNRQVLEGNWNQFKGKIQKKWAQLTDNDLREFDGNVDELVGVIQRKTGEGREAVEKFLDELTDNTANFAGQAAQYVREGAGQAAQYVREGAHQAAESLRGSARRTADQVSEWTEGTGYFVRERPGLALAITFGIGVVVGSLLTAKCRSK